MELERIDKKYAIIYVHRDTSEMQDVSEYMQRFLIKPTGDIQALMTDYYNHPGPLQWNYYFMRIGKLSDELKKEFEKNSEYSRKFSFETEKEYSKFMYAMFPDYDEKIAGKAEIIKDTSPNGPTQNKYLDYLIIPPVYPNFNDLAQILYIDSIRAMVVRGTNVALHSHVHEDQYFFYKKMFLFLEGAEKIINKLDHDETV